MDLVRDLLLFLHFIGLAAVFGGLFVQLRNQPRAVNSAMVHGILTQLVTGLALVGVIEADDAAVPAQFHAKIGVKLVITLAIAVLVFANRKRVPLMDGAFFGMLGLTVLNIAVAVFWNLG